MKRPTLRVLEYRHSKTHPWYLDLRPFNRGRKFFKTKAEAEAERLRQITTLERHGREAVGLSPGELSAIIEARKKLAKHGKTINDAATFYLDYLERIRRCNVTVADLAKEVLEAKRKDGMSATYIDDLKKRLADHHSLRHPARGADRRDVGKPRRSFPAQHPEEPRPDDVEQENRRQSPLNRSAMHPSIIRPTADFA